MREEHATLTTEEHGEEAGGVGTDHPLAPVGGAFGTAEPAETTCTDVVDVDPREEGKEDSRKVSYKNSGHEIKKHKDFWRVNPKPPTVSTKTWMMADSRTGRIKLLNEYRRARNLRTSDSWSELMVYLMEEHAPFLADVGHVFPWGGTPGPSNKGPPPEDEGSVKAVTLSLLGNALRIKLMTSDAVVPTRGTEGAAGLDLYSTETCTVPP